MTDAATNTCKAVARHRAAVGRMPGTRSASSITASHPEAFDDRLAVHDAVRVHDEHVFVLLSPPAAKIGDVAQLRVQVDGATAVEEARLRKAFPQLVHGALLDDVVLELAAVRQQDVVEMVGVFRKVARDRLS